jgi:3-deoxy-manno-octulosonate cytidylyltransferase (CMP-KDO synthetase)
MKVLIVIPARYGSTRFPGKPLAMLGSRSLIQRVFDQVRKSPLPDRIVVATDDERILQHVKSFGAEAMISSAMHPSGTHRCEEILSQLESHGYHPDILINVQGDEPLFNPDDIGLLCSAFPDSDSPGIATLKHLMSNPDEIQNPSVVKVACNIHGNALYFSRASIPYQRDPEQNNLYYRHLGVYAFRPAVLHELVKLPASQLELAENLEQLRWLEHGYAIRVLETAHSGIGIDNPSDIDNFALLSPLD